MNSLKIHVNKNRAQNVWITCFWTIAACSMHWWWSLDCARTPQPNQFNVFHSQNDFLQTSIKSIYVNLFSVFFLIFRYPFSVFNWLDFCLILFIYFFADDDVFFSVCLIADKIVWFDWYFVFNFNTQNRTPKEVCFLFLSIFKRLERGVCLYIVSFFHARLRWFLLNFASKEVFQTHSHIHICHTRDVLMRSIVIYLPHSLLLSFSFALFQMTVLHIDWITTMESIRFFCSQWNKISTNQTVKKTTTQQF